MKPIIVPTAIPVASLLARRTAGSHFHDCYRMNLAGDTRTALELYLDVLARTPAWVDRSMALRNRIVSRLGLKDLGMLGDVDRTKRAQDYRIGDRVGIFSLLHVSDDEVILGDSDRHLDVQVSVCRLAGEDAVATSTVVHVHRPLGHLYMFFVAPVHRRIVPAVLARLPRQ